MTAKPTAGLRFAALVRVSTERQEAQGESLRVQKDHNAKDVELLGGRIVEWYGGAEHGTPGFEKREVDRLVRDAARGKFDAVIVTHADRWSRDNAKSQEGRDVFKKHGVRFFVSVSEYDLFNPEHEMFLGVSAVLGRFAAATQNRKSLLSKIHRARRGLPACGRLPFGRTFDEKTEQWGIDADKLKIVQDAARRYLDGEPLPDVAASLGMPHSNLHRILNHRCGDTWHQRFDSDDLNIHEVVPTTIPRLLPEETIRAIHSRVEANRTYTHGQAKHSYLLGRMVFCGCCGTAMSGQTQPTGTRFYRHVSQKRRKVVCTRAGSQGWVNADELEEAVVITLFACFGNPAAVHKAVEEAIPDRSKVNETRDRHALVSNLLEKVKAARGRIVDAIAADAITVADAKKRMEKLNLEEKQHSHDLEQLEKALEHVPTDGEIKAGVVKFLEVTTGLINEDLGDMSWDEARQLCQLVFGGRTIDGKRLGVYVESIPGQDGKRRKKWTIRIQGRLIDRLSPVPFDDDAFNNADAPPFLQDDLMDAVTSDASLRQHASCYSLPFVLSTLLDPTTKCGRG